MQIVLYPSTGEAKKRPVEDMPLTRLEFRALDPFFLVAFVRWAAKTAQRTNFVSVGRSFVRWI